MSRALCFGFLVISVFAAWATEAAVEEGALTFKNRDLALLVENTESLESGFTSIAGTVPDWLSRHRCREIRSSDSSSPSPGLRTTCCTAEKGGADRPVKCLPSFIIGGTQKSGTTALAAYLASHPDISFSQRKEVHFFSDGKKRKNLRIEDYFKAFPAWNYSHGSPFESHPPINGDATPYYLASRLSCRKIARTMPHVKVVVLMREPVSRAWSEYQMKRRRVETQDGFIRLLSDNADKMRLCLLRAERSVPQPGSERWEAIKSCVPAAVSAHVNWPKLKASFGQKLGNSSYSWQRVVHGCFPLAGDRVGHNGKGGGRARGRRNDPRRRLDIGAGSGTGMARSHPAAFPLASASRRYFDPSDFPNQQQRLLRHSGVESLYREGGGYQDEDALQWNWGWGGYLEGDGQKNDLGKNHSEGSQTVAPLSLPSVESAPNTSVSSGPSLRRVLMVSKRSDRRRSAVTGASYGPPASLLPGGGASASALDRSTVSESFVPSEPAGPAVSFRPLWCLEKAAKERLKTPEAAFRDEIDRFVECAGGLLAGTKSSKLPTLRALDAAVEKCVTIKVGIADNYFYRSLYVAQLFNCLRYLPRDSFLLMPSERLQRDPVRAVTRVLEFLGLSMHPNVARLVGAQNENQSKSQNNATGRRAESETETEGGGEAAALNASFISAAVRAHFPRFELTTGWASVGAYEPLDPALRRKLADFLLPFNELLWEFLGEDWSEEWAQGGASE